MPKRPIEMEREILADGWQFKNQEGAHRHYTHPTKPGKVTIPFQENRKQHPKAGRAEISSGISETGGCIC